MGSSQSNTILTSEVAVTGLILLAGAYFFATQSGVLAGPGQNKPSASKGASSGVKSASASAKSKKKTSGKKAAANASDNLKSAGKSDIASSVDTLVAVGDEPGASSGKASTSKLSRDSTPLPGSFLAPEDAAPITTASSKNKKKKAAKSSSVTSTPSASTTLPPLQTSPAPPTASSSASAGGTTTSSVVDDDGWTKVGRGGVGSDAEFPSLSKATAAVGKKSKGKDKGSSTTAAAAGGEPEQQAEEKQTLAEKLLPKPVPTVVDDMLDAPAGIARVMRVVGPESATPQPPAGFSWRDFEDSDLAGQSQTDDDEGWASVPTKKRKTPAAGATSGSGSATPTVRHTEVLTKKQRQNIARREAEKAAKADAERERLAKLAKHKRDLENERIRAQYDKGKLSGGMKASVDANGALIWE